MAEKRYKIRLNSIDKVEELLQEIYDQACRSLNEIQNEMNKLSVSTNLADADMDMKAKYAKSMHDYIGDKSKAISLKLEISKFMGEILKNGGDVNATLNDPTFSQKTRLDLKELRETINATTSNSGEKFNLK